MILRRIEVRNFRKLSAPVVLEALPEGLVIIAGDNEEGKSTLLAALRAAFFYKHSWNGQVVEALQPYGSAVRPEVTVAFDLHGNHYQLHKAFCQQKSCELATPQGRLTGDAAEQELARLLGAAPPGRATGGDENHGPLGLLWVQQGGAWSTAVSESGSGGLRKLLEHEVGDVLGGPRAQRIMAGVAERYAEVLTPGGKPTGDFKRRGEERAELARQLDELDAKIAAHTALRQALADNLTQLARYREQLPELAERLRAAEQQSAEAQGLASKLREIQIQHQSAQARAELQASAWEHRQQLRAAVAQAADEHRLRLAAHAEAEQAWRSATAASDAAEGQVAERSAALAQAEARLAGALAAAELAELEAKTAAVAARLESARQAEQNRRHLRAEAGALDMDDASLAELRQLEAALRAAEAAAAAAATGIRVALAEGYTATMNGAPIAPDWSGTPLQGARIEIGSAAGPAATLTLTPAAAAADPLAQRRARQAAWEAAATRRRIATVAEAEQRLARRRQLEQEILLAGKDLERHTPEGLDQLEVEAQVLERNLAALRRNATDTAPGPGTASLPPMQAEAAARRAELSEAASLARMAAVQREHSQSALAAAANEARGAQERWTARHSELAAAAAADDDASVQAKLAAARQLALGLAAQLAPLQAQLDSLDPQRLAAQLEMARQAHRHLEADLRSLEDTSNRQRGALATTEAWDEQRESAATDLVWTDRRYAELQRRAEGLQRLRAALAAARDQAEERFLAPILSRVVPLLRRLLPDAALVLDASMNVRGLRRGAHEEPFASLSLGTREQLAILVRLAFADLLRAQGQAAITILDDAPAYADPTRFAAMLEILHTAAQSGQILVLTCRERDFRPCGAPVLRFRGAAREASV